MTDWAGRQVTAQEAISDRQLGHFRAVLAGTLAPLAVPPGLHWSLMPDVGLPDQLGRDGHARQGIFVPELGLPRRMWAGGELRFVGPDLTPGDLVTRDSTFDAPTYKTGSSGALAFLAVHHRILSGGTLRIEERQDIVYREDVKPGAPARIPTPGDDWPDATAWPITPGPVLLFRYSALTFNAHRIHYDLPYATGVESYAGLVVHGPLQATWMLNLATKILGHLPRVFAYRGLSPLICGTPVRVEARQAETGLDLRVRRDDAVVTMQATVTA